MRIEDRDARLCGAAYLAVVVTGILSLAWLPAKLGLGDDPAHMLAAISANAAVYRAGLVAWLLNQLAFIALGFAFYRVLRSAGSTLAPLMLALVCLSVPLGLTGAVHRLDALTWASAGIDLRDEATRAALVGHAIQSWRNTILVVQLFWGLWLLPLAVLLWRTRLVPRLLSVLLALGCGSYLLVAFGDVALPGFGTSSVARVAILPASVGEIGTCLWLLLAGARSSHPRG